jgi:hypothetical protein
LRVKVQMPRNWSLLTFALILPAYTNDWFIISLRETRRLTYRDSYLSSSVRNNHFLNFVFKRILYSIVFLSVTNPMIAIFLPYLHLYETLTICTYVLKTKHKRITLKKSIFLFHYLYIHVNNILSFRNFWNDAFNSLSDIIQSFG